MGKKTNPRIIRCGNEKSLNLPSLMNTNWCNNKNYAKLLHQDILIRDHVSKNLNRTLYSEIEIIRDIIGNIDIYIVTTKPGLVIGKKGVDINRLGNKLCSSTGLKIKVKISDKSLTAKGIANALYEKILEQRMDFKKSIRLILPIVKNDIDAMMIIYSGRLKGASIARREVYRHGSLKRQTFSNHIDEAKIQMKFKYGICGLKVICRLKKTEGINNGI